MDPLATTEHFAAYTGASVDNSQLQQVLFLLRGISDDIRTYCGWSITAEDGVSWTVDSDGSTVLAVPSLHLRDVTTVTADGEELDLADLEWSQDGYLINRCRWPRKLRSVVVGADHGYTETPAVLVTIACSMVSRLAGTAGKGAVSSVGIGDYSETRPNVNALTGAVGPDMLGASPTELNILDRYRIALRS